MTAGWGTPCRAVQRGAIDQAGLCRFQRWSGSLGFLVSVRTPCLRLFACPWLVVTGVAEEGVTGHVSPAQGNPPPGGAGERKQGSKDVGRACHAATHLRLKDLPHMRQVKGFSWVCDRTCRLRWSCLENDCEHQEQTNPRLPFVRISGMAKDVEQAQLTDTSSGSVGTGNARSGRAG